MAAHLPLRVFACLCHVCHVCLTCVCLCVCLYACVGRQLAENERNRAEIARLSAALSAAHQDVATLRGQAAEAEASHSAALAAVKAELAAVTDAVTAAKREIDVLQARLAQANADVTLHQEARKAAENKYQTQLQVGYRVAPGSRWLCSSWGG